MIEKDENAVIRKIVALQKTYTSARREFKELKVHAREKHTELSDTEVELKAAVKDSRIGDKTIQNAENEIAVLKKKISETDSDLELVDQELKRMGDESAKLSTQKDALMEKIAPINSQLQLTMDDLHESEKELQATFSTIDAHLAQKAGLTTEISEKLSNVAVEKEQGDKALDAFSMDFGKLAIEREEIKKTFNKREKVLSALKEEIAALEGKCISIEEVVELEKKKSLFEAHVTNLEAEKETSREKSTRLEKALSQKEDELNLIESGKAEKETLAETLADEVGEFDELAAKAKTGNNELVEADALVEEALFDLKKRFSGGVGTEREFGSKWGLSS